MGATCSDNRTTVEKQVDEFIAMLKNCPDLSKYAGDKQRQQTFLNSWKSKIFGGSIFDPVGTPNKPKSRPN
jgi:hypothetical protein